MEAVHNQADALAKPMSVCVRGVQSAYVFVTFFGEKKMKLKIEINFMFIGFFL